jgi:hypothetical protein
VEEQAKPKREWKARFAVKPFTDSVDEMTIKALEHLCPEKRVVLHYSTGKDSIAAWIALRDAGFEVVPVYKEIIPDMSFMDSVIAAHEKYFGVEVLKVPYNTLFNNLHNIYGGFDEECNIMNKAAKSNIGSMDKMKKEFNDHILNYTGCSISIIGVKSSDSLHRRTNFAMSGPYNANQRMYSLCWRLAKNAPLKMIMDAKCPLPRYYLWLGRSPSMLFASEYYFIKKYYPQDWEKILKFLPDADVMVKDYEMSDKPRILATSKLMKEAFEAGYEFV